MATGSPLYATAMYGATNASSTCASPATSTDSRGDLSPTTMAKLPGLQFAISHRRADLRLPSLVRGASFDANNGENVAMKSNALYLSMQQCETPHYAPGVPTCPETSPMMEKKSSRVDDGSKDKKRKKGTRRGTLNAEAKNVLKAWMFSPEHFAHPYPSEDEKEELAVEAGIEVKQLSNWFTNARKRLWQPVLRQSGVEVKNFLSTGRGGPRGNKLEVPPNLHHLIAQKEAEIEREDEETDSPPSSPRALPASSQVAPSSSSSAKRSWSEMHSSPAPSSMPASADEVAPKKKKSAQRKRVKDDKKEAAVTAPFSSISQELRQALGHSPMLPTTGFREIEIMAAASLIGLHHQQFQPVH